MYKSQIKSPEKLGLCLFCHTKILLQVRISTQCTLSLEAPQTQKLSSLIHPRLTRCLTGFEFWPNIGLNNNSCHHSCQSWWWGASKKVVKLGSNGGFQISILKTTRNVNFEKVLHWCRDPVQMLSCLVNPHSSLSSPSADQTLTFSTALQDTASQKCIFSFIPVLTVC